MATRSRIGLRLADDSILSVYHHWDGYPEWLGVTLKSKFNTRDKVAELIDGGNMSSCDSDNVYDYEKKEFVKRAPQVEYYGGADEAPRLDVNEYNYFKNNEEYAYIFENDDWTCYKIDGGYSDVGLQIRKVNIPEPELESVAA